MLNITVDKQRLYLFVFHRQRNWKKGKKKSKMFTSKVPETRIFLAPLVLSG